VRIIAALVPGGGVRTESTCLRGVAFWPLQYRSYGRARNHGTTHAVQQAAAENPRRVDYLSGIRSFESKGDATVERHREPFAEAACPTRSLLKKPTSQRRAFDSDGQAAPLQADRNSYLRGGGPVAVFVLLRIFEVISYR
jgi:hypothetical protein